MPNIFFAPPARPDPFAYANSDALGQVFDVINKSKKSNYEEKLLQEYLDSGRINLEQDQPEGFLGKLWDVVNPKGTYRGGTNSLSPVTQNLLTSMVRDPLETEAIEADIDYKKSRAKYYSEGGSSNSFGATPWYLSPEWMNTPQGRAAQEKALEGKSEDEQLKHWLTIQNSAGGNYFYPQGLDGGATAPKNQDVYNLASGKIGEILANRNKNAGNKTTSSGQASETAAKPQGEQGKSPFPDYPDAFQEDGVWKVIRNGKKYRIED